MRRRRKRRRSSRESWRHTSNLSNGMKRCR
jgi:hypothetical protein